MLAAGIFIEKNKLRVLGDVGLEGFLGRVPRTLELGIKILEPGCLSIIRTSRPNPIMSLLPSTRKDLKVKLPRIWNRVLAIGELSPILVDLEQRKTGSKLTQVVDPRGVLPYPLAD